MTECKPFRDAKRAMLLDMLRRATANGSHKEVAETILADWFPMLTVDSAGRVGIKVASATDYRFGYGDGERVQREETEQK